MVQHIKESRKLPALGFPEYEVTTDGEVIGKRGRPMVGHIDRCGYREVILSYYPQRQMQKLVHRLILSTFKPTEGMDVLDVNHIDGNKLNNRLENLEWCTRSENINHSYKNRLQTKVSNQYGSFRVLNDEDMQNIYKMLKNGKTDSEIARVIGCSRELIGRKRRQYFNDD